MAASASWAKRILIGVLVFGLVLIGVLAVVQWYTKLGTTLPGMAAKSACSAHFVAGRPADVVYEQDVLPASSVTKYVTLGFDEESRAVTASVGGLFKRTAWYVDAEHGCVLDLKPEQPAPLRQFALDQAAWPAGDATLPAAQWPEGVDVQALNATVEEAFVGAGDPAAANARGVAVVQDGKLLVRREAPGFEDDTPLHGWSMTKTVNAMLFYAVAKEKGLSLEAPVVDSFPAGREPAWVEQWRQDERRDITINDLLHMRDGLANQEGYEVLSTLPRILWSEPDMSGYAAGAPAAAAAGTRWEYLTVTANILSAVTRAQFETDEEYLAFPRKLLFEPLGLDSATLETDTAGTWVGGSYLWASVADWTRLGQFMMDGGRWEGRQILPPGWLKVATTRSMPTGEGRGYGAQTWLPAEPLSGYCKEDPRIPPDTMTMEGHWGQVVAMVPSRNAVITRLGWTVADGQFDDCAFLGDVLASLRK